MLHPAERLERLSCERGILDRRVAPSIQVPLKPAGGDAAVSPRVLLCDQGGQLDQLDERRPAELAERGLGGEQIAVLDGSVVDRPRVALCGQFVLPGAGRTAAPNIPAGPAGPFAP